MRHKTISAERAFTPRANHGYKYLALLAIPGTQPLKRHSVIWRSSAQLGTLCKYLSFPFSGVPKIKEYTIGSQKRLDVLWDMNKLILVVLLVPTDHPVRAAVKVVCRCRSGVIFLCQLVTKNSFLSFFEDLRS